MIYLYAPFYNDKSNGIAVTYELIRILNHSGIEAKVLCYENERYDVEIPDPLKPYYVSKAQMPKTVADDDVVIYLDTADGNVFHAKNVVYWLLNKPGALTGQKLNFQPNDILAAYSTLVHKGLPQLFILKDERKLFSNLRAACRKRTDTVSLYFGKVNIRTVLDKNAQLREIINKYKRIHVITRLSPAERERTLRCIAQSDLLISYDPLSNINYEATLLSTPVLMMDDTYQIQHTVFNVGNYGFAFSEVEIQSARSVVERAFAEYCKWLENQEASVITSFQRIMNHMVQIKTDPQSLRANGAANERAKADFETFYENLGETFTNINFLNDIPFETRRIIHMDGKMTKIPDLPAVTNKSKDENKNENKKTTGLRKIYSSVKPEWVNDTYRKMPGDLKLRELVFLMFRRVFVCLKRKSHYRAPKSGNIENTEKA